tara:strand:+ start:16557 stop:17522 length:966 start_codon:yes stop_codon:yes gene_type:complete
MKKKILICGVGSIGERHINNLIKLGYKNIILYRTKKKKLRTVKENFTTYTNLLEALKQKPEIAFICSPTHLHLETAIKCVQNKCHVFIEKPISHNLKGYKKLQRLVIKNRKHVTVGYMMRFHPCILQIKKWIEEKKIGKILHFKSEWGEYMPAWHPWEDYRISYAGKKEMGGGPILTLSHEIDLCLLFCGEYNKIYSNYNSISKLKLNTEDLADILISFKSGTCANLHLNYLSRPPTRKLDIIGSKGQISFNYYENQAKLFINGIQRKSFNATKKFQRNDLFINEIKDFLFKIDKKNPTTKNIDHAFKIVKIANRVKNLNI